MLVELVFIALGIALNPPAVIAVIILLSAPHGQRGAIGFVAGWVAGLAVVGAIALYSGGLADMWSAPYRVALSVRLVLGIVLVALAIATWRKHRSAAPQEELPGWMRSIERLTGLKAFGTAAAFAALNPKTLALNIAGVVVITGAGLSPAAEWFLLGLFVALASTTVVAPAAYSAAAPDRSGAALARFRVWLVANNYGVTASVLLLLGLMLLRAAIQLFSGA